MASSLREDVMERIGKLKAKIDKLEGLLEQLLKLGNGKDQGKEKRDRSRNPLSASSPEASALPKAPFGWTTVSRRNVNKKIDEKDVPKPKWRLRPQDWNIPVHESDDVKPGVSGAHLKDVMQDKGDHFAIVTPRKIEGTKENSQEFTCQLLNEKDRIVHQKKWYTNLGKKTPAHPRQVLERNHTPKIEVKNV